jgi:hypothetical protein
MDLEKVVGCARSRGKGGADEPFGSSNTGAMPWNWGLVEDDDRKQWPTSDGIIGGGRRGCRGRWGKKKDESFFHLKHVRGAGVCGRVGPAGTGGRVHTRWVTEELRFFGRNDLQIVIFWSFIALTLSTSKNIRRVGPS